MTRLFARTFVSAFVMTTVLTGCQEAAGPGEAVDPRETEAAAETQTAPAVEPGLRWEAISSGEGQALVLMDAGDRPLLHLACLRDPARLTARVSDFQRIGSEERMTLGVGDEAFLLVADPMLEEPGVYAEGPIPEDLLARLPATREISAVYGAQRLGPHQPPEPAQAETFVAGCREIAAGADAA